MNCTRYVKTVVYTNEKLSLIFPPSIHLLVASHLFIDLNTPIASLKTNILTFISSFQISMFKKAALVVLSLGASVIGIYYFKPKYLLLASAR